MHGTKRSGITTLVGALVVIIIILVGIAGYAFLYPPTAPSSTVTSVSTVQGQLAGLKVGMIVPIDSSDNSWNYQAEAQLKALQKVEGFSLQVVENKVDGSAAQPIAEGWASSGYNVIFLQGNQYQTMTSSIANKYPSTLFVCVDCYAANYSNVYRIWLDLGEAGFIIGVMAGKLTQSNNIGMIGGGRVASIWAGHEGFKLGALLTNPSVTFSEKYEQFAWSDSAGAAKDATQMISNGADVVFSSGDGIDVGVLQAASSASTHVWANNVYTNLSAIKPSVDNILMGSIVVNWGPLYSAALNAYVNGNWAWGYLTANMASGIVTVQPGPQVPANIRAIANNLQSMIISQTLSMSFAVDPNNPGTPICFAAQLQTPVPSSCADTNVNNTAAQLNFIPNLS